MIIKGDGARELFASEFLVALIEVGGAEGVVSGDETGIERNGFSEVGDGGVEILFHEELVARFVFVAGFAGRFEVELGDGPAGGLERAGGIRVLAVDEENVAVDVDGFDGVEADVVAKACVHVWSGEGLGRRGGGGERQENG